MSTNTKAQSLQSSQNGQEIQLSLHSSYKYHVTDNGTLINFKMRHLKANKFKRGYCALAPNQLVDQILLKVSITPLPIFPFCIPSSMGHQASTQGSHQEPTHCLFLLKCSHPSDRQSRSVLPPECTLLLFRPLHVHSHFSVRFLIISYLNYSNPTSF